VRLAGRSSLSAEDVCFSAVVFGAGDWRTRTEERPLPHYWRWAIAWCSVRLRPPCIADSASAPRRAALRRRCGNRVVGIARHGRPIQYAYMREALALWDVWTSIAAEPVAFEAPSAGFALDWRALARLRSRGAGFATITLAAGISRPAIRPSMLGCARRPYRVTRATASAIRDAKARGGMSSPLAPP